MPVLTLTANADKIHSVQESLILLLAVLIILTALIAVIKVREQLAEKKKSENNALSVPVAGVAVGVAGDLDLHDVDDWTAAMIMAIVADHMKVPLNALRFKSIRQIEEVK